MSTERNVDKQAVLRTQSRARTSSLLARVRERSTSDRHTRFTNLYSHLSVDLLRDSFYELNRSATPGIDGVTWARYAVNLESNLTRLHKQLHTGTYQARPVLRRYILKRDGRQRPLGLTTLEDKLVQQACAALLQAVYEPLFAGFSYGFRTGCQPHHALDALYAGVVRKKIRYVLDADIKGFFDAIDHDLLLNALKRHISDPRLLRLICKWLKTGHVEDGTRHPGTVGTPQGGVISPILGNIYLHYALDLYAEKWRKSQTRGDMIIVRYADDFVVGFQYYHEAERFRRDLAARFEQVKLTLHPEKTRLIEFGRFAEQNRLERGEGRPETFDFLGFTHCCAKTTQGKFWIRRLTIKSRLRDKLLAIKQQLWSRMHQPISVTSAWLRSVITGYMQYHAIPGNMGRVGMFRDEVVTHWLRVIRRRSQKGRKWTWARFNQYLNPLLPQPTLCHPLPLTRFDATTQGRSRMK